jgi:hypothetical protein
MKYLKAISCFNHEEDIKNEIGFKADDDLDYCKTLFCRYYTFSKKILQTIRNAPPWGIRLFRYALEIIPASNKNIIQRVLIDGEWEGESFRALSGEWRRRQFSNSLTTWWGKWINIDDIINSILTDEDKQKQFVENWNRYMIIDESIFRAKRYRNRIMTIDEIIEQIKTGKVKNKT